MDDILYIALATLALIALFSLRKKARQARAKPFSATNMLALLTMGVLASVYFSSIREIVEKEGTISQRSLVLSLGIGLGIYCTVYALLRLVQSFRHLDTTS